MNIKTAAIEAAIRQGNIKVYDVSMDEPGCDYPWAIAIPGSYTVEPWNTEQDALCEMPLEEAIKIRAKLKF